MLKKVFLLLCAFGILATPAFALPRRSPAGAEAGQSPNNAGAVVKDAKVSLRNNQTGAVRESLSGSEGSASFPALSLTGTYTVSVSKQGFGDETRNDITLRSGEMATLKVKLLVGTEKTDVTVYGTNDGVRADSQIGQRL